MIRTTTKYNVMLLAVFFIVPIVHGMEEPMHYGQSINPQDHKKEFKNFLKKINAAKKMSANSVGKLLINTGAKIAGGYDAKMVAENLAYLERFIDKENKKLKNQFIEAFGTKKDIETINRLWEQANQQNISTTNIESLSAIFKAESIKTFNVILPMEKQLTDKTTKDEMLALFRAQDGKNNYLIPNEYYFSHILSTLFIVYLQEKK